MKVRFLLICLLSLFLSIGIYTGCDDSASDKIANVSANKLCEITTYTKDNHGKVDCSTTTEAECNNKNTEPVNVITDPNLKKEITITAEVVDKCLEFPGIKGEELKKRVAAAKWLEKLSATMPVNKDATDKLHLTPLLDFEGRLTNELLIEFNKHITIFTGLKQINLAGNKLKTLPANIGKLKELAGLSLNSNELSTLPASIANLTKLTRLYLAGNQLSTLPVIIFKLKELTYLGLNSNKLEIFPKEISMLTKLTELDLNNNQLSTLPASIGNLTKLTRLYLTGNKLSKLPVIIFKLTNLETLSLAKNGLSTLPASIGNLTNLQMLYLTANKLKTLPKEIGKLTKLTYLDLNNNELSTLPKEIGNLTKLKRLNLTNINFSDEEKIKIKGYFCKNKDGSKKPDCTKPTITWSLVSTSFPKDY